MLDGVRYCPLCTTEGQRDTHDHGVEAGTVESRGTLEVLCCVELGLEISLGLEAAIRLVVAIVEALGGGLGGGKGEGESENLSFGEHDDSECIRRRV